MNPIDSNAEWIEADGLGGFASGTVSGIRSRRYHALLLTATTPPAGRMVLVNGFDAWVETPNGTVALSSQRYGPDVIHPDGATRIETFEYEPWPRWRYKIDNDTIIEQELFVPKGESAVFISWKLVSNRDADVKLKVRPFLSRREYYSNPLERAADAYLVKRGQGKTLIAGYPWFGDWGRDTFIAIRGLCIGTGHLEDARDILLAWAGVVSQGMLPNRFPDSGEQPEFNSVDASLWYIIAVNDYLRAAKKQPTLTDDCHTKKLLAAVEAILAGFNEGTRFGIRADRDGLLSAGEHGQQLTWMDARVDGREITPRIGKPVEIQALWLNALAIGAKFSAHWKSLFDKGRAAFEEKFWNEHAGYLADVVDCDHRPGTVDLTFRPNQIFAVGGLPLQLLSQEKARRVVDAVEMLLLTPVGLRSLAPGEPRYAPHYQGGSRERDAIYHQGTVWPWLIGSFVEAWVRVRGSTSEAKAEARAKFLPPIYQHLNEAGLGHISEICDAELPHTPRGCPFQAWSLGELLRLERAVLA